MKRRTFKQMIASASPDQMLVALAVAEAVSVMERDEPLESAILSFLAANAPWLVDWYGPAARAL